jgi:hypothetical protein
MVECSWLRCGDPSGKGKSERETESVAVPQTGAQVNQVTVGAALAGLA